MCTKHQMQLESSKIKQLIVSGRLHHTGPLLQASTTRFDTPSQKILGLPTLSTTTCIKLEPNMLILFLPALPKNYPLFLFYSHIIPIIPILFFCINVSDTYRTYSGKVWLLNSLFSSIWQKKIWQINRSAIGY